MLNLLAFNFMNDIFTPYILPALGVLLTGLGSWLMTTIVNWLNTTIKNKKAAELLVTITNIASNAVKVTYQTFVEAIKGTDEWNDEAKEKALNMSLEAAKRALTIEAIEYIQKTHGDLDTYLISLIESLLYDFKYQAKLAKK